MLRLALPKGRMQRGVIDLLLDAGVRISAGERDYRPQVYFPGIEAKLLKPQSIVEMLHVGSRDLGFAGADWVKELGADLVELIDTKLDPVRLVAAAPTDLLVGAELPKRLLVVASEYSRLTQQWIAEEHLVARFVRSYGATEVLPPEDADCIVDITQSGATLSANRLTIVRDLMSSSTRLYAHPLALENPDKRALIDRLVMLIGSVLEARRRVMLELNVDPDHLAAVISVLPCMREPTISPLHGNAGFAVRAAVPKESLAALIPEIKARGGTDVVVSALSQIVP